MPTSSLQMRQCPTCRRATREDSCPDDGSDTVPLLAAPLAQQGDEIDGRYRIVGPVGEGGFGQVFEAVHLATKQRIAIKIRRENKASSAGAAARFEAEARTCALLSSPHTVRIADHGATADGRLYIAMEFLQGESLGQRLRRCGALSPHEAVAIATQVLEQLRR